MTRVNVGDMIVDNEISEVSEVSEAAQSEKMIPQSEVNAIVQKQKALAAEKARREYEQERGNYQAKLEQPSFDKDALIAETKQAVIDDYKKQQASDDEARQKAEIEKIAHAYHTKMGAGAEIYSDFDDTLKDFNPAAFSRTSMLAAQADNTAAIMYELAKNPSKLATIESIAGRDVNMARAMIQRLSASITEAEDAKKIAQTQNANEPLSRVQSSVTGSDNGEMSVNDYRSQSWLRA